MGRTFRIKLHLRRFARRHPWITFTLRSLMVFSVVFGAACTANNDQTGIALFEQRLAAIFQGGFAAAGKVE